MILALPMGYFENDFFWIALMGTASPGLEKQGFFAVVFVNREYSGQQEGWCLEERMFVLLKQKKHQFYN